MEALFYNMYIKWTEMKYVYNTLICVYGGGALL